MHFLNDSNQFMANVYIHEWITSARAVRSAFHFLRSVIRYSASMRRESRRHPIDSWQMFRLSGMTCGELLR
jgi:hypothetical protein